MIYSNCAAWMTNNKYPMMAMETRSAKKMLNIKGGQVMFQKGINPPARETNYIHLIMITEELQSLESEQNR